jgi:Uma2 family endonuclease
MSSTVRLITADELLTMPPDGFRYELVKGELIKMAPASYEHGIVAMSFGSRLFNHVTANNLGKVCGSETGFVVSSNPDTVLAPDAAFIERERADQVGMVRGYFPGVPDLAVEVISPNDTYTEVREKALEWLAAGTRMVIVLNPRKRNATVYRSENDITILSEDDVLDIDDIVKGFKVHIKDIFG